MEITSLPTESLYKFAALSGIIIILGTVVYVYKLLTATRIKVIELEIEVAVATLKMKYTLDDAERESDLFITQTAKLLGVKVSEVIDQIENPEKIIIDRSKKIDSTKAEKAIKVSDEIIQFLRKISADKLGIDILNESLKGKQNLRDFEIRQLRILQGLGLIAIAIGFLLIYYGFSHWIVIQGYIDKSTIREGLKK